MARQTQSAQPQSILAMGLLAIIFGSAMTMPTMAQDVSPKTQISIHASYQSPLTAPLNAANVNGRLCTEAVTVCARDMRPLGVAVGGSFTVRIEDHFSATYECTMIDGKPRWIAINEQGACAPQPVIFLPAQYDADDPWNVG